MSNLTVKDLFIIIKNYFKERKNQDILFDGQKNWQPFKNLLNNNNWTFEWIPPDIDIYNENINLPEYINDQIIEQNHFLIQCVRIPTTEEPCLRKLIQIALNIGQYEGSTNTTLSYNDISNYISSNDANTSLGNILSENDINLLNSLIN